MIPIACTPSLLFLCAVSATFSRIFFYLSVLFLCVKMPSFLAYFFLKTSSIVAVLFSVSSLFIFISEMVSYSFMFILFYHHSFQNFLLFIPITSFLNLSNFDVCCFITSIIKKISLILF